MAKAAHFGPINLKDLYINRITADCDDLVAFVEALQDGIQHQLHHANAALQQFAEQHGQDIDALVDNLAYEADGLANRFPPLLWQSVFIAIYSLFEQEMNDLCVRVRDTAQQRGIAQGPRPAIAGIVLPAQVCMRRFNIRLAVGAPEWRRFQGYVGIRNAIAHNHGRLRNDQQGNDTRMYVRYHAHIRLDGNQLVIEREFCERAIEDMRSILVRTVRAIPARLFST